MFLYLSYQTEALFEFTSTTTEVEVDLFVLETTQGENGGIHGLRVDATHKGDVIRWG